MIATTVIIIVSKISHDSETSNRGCTLLHAMCPVHNRCNRVKQSGADMG